MPALATLLHESEQAVNEHLRRFLRDVMSRAGDDPRLRLARDHACRRSEMSRIRTEIGLARPIVEIPRMI
jgi:hypothetical protein